MGNLNRRQFQLFFLLYALLIACVTGNEISFDQFQADNPGIDYSSHKVCFVYGASKVTVVEGNPQLGYQCKVRLEGFSENKKDAKEVCESKLPYYIVDAAPQPNEGFTSCTFQINLFCDFDHVQIHGKCYKLVTGFSNLQEAEKKCSYPKDGDQARLAQYYSKNLQLYFEQIDHIDDAWVTIPDMKDYYDNGSGGAKGVYVQDGAWKYDVSPGTILMDDPESLHQAICEYTPAMTMAEMFYLAKIYSEIYPFEIYNGGAVIPTSSYQTVFQRSLAPAKNNKEEIPHFDTKHFNEVCMSIGKILNVKSYPMTGIEEEYNDVKDRLTRHRFHLTNAFKDDGCKKADFVQWNMDDTFNRVYQDCPPGPAWSEPPVQYKRTYGRVFCHYVSNKDVKTRLEAIDACEKIDAALTGFDSAEEFDAVRKSVNPQYPPGSYFDPNKGLPRKFFGPEKDGIQIDDHYWLGGKSPCENACDDEKFNKRHEASWANGVAVNNDFLNHGNHEGSDWAEKEKEQYVSFRSDKSAFHIHPEDFLYKKMFYICGKSSDLKPAERQKGGLGSGRM
ncbi:hypothetical protein CAEBREN_19919 [Caenorhabditis brenneri]|uniref:C-type lectin domain-containing protein n=1 Tax=Caenorhabditis brenneri TaxID=135651 RepID=G0MJT3_CAEBE|nr:hypothetical protein CAEBREN_19919 [Caenorhabditis brenneri]